MVSVTVYLSDYARKDGCDESEVTHFEGELEKIIYGPKSSSSFAPRSTPMRSGENDTYTCTSWC